MDDATLYLIVALTTVGFCLLAFMLLAAVYLFLKRERKAGEEWTDAVQQQKLREDTRSSNGSSAPHRPPADEE
jgi:hypothetical protein